MQGNYFLVIFKARSIAVALNGAGFVVGMKDGTMRIFDGKLV